MADNANTNAVSADAAQTVPATSVATEIDYDKISNILEGRQESVLKGYFKDQGLSKEEVEQAIAQFKEQKAAKQPGVGALQRQLADAQQTAQQAMIERQATLEAMGLGIDVKSLPYVLKMADTSAVVGEDGKVNGEALKNSINKVLEDVPALKPEKPKDTPKLTGVSPGEPGDSTPDPAKSGYEARLAEARKNNDTLGAIQVKQEAAAEGVALM